MGRYDRVAVSTRQAGNRFLGSLKGLQIRGSGYEAKTTGVGFVNICNVPEGSPAQGGGRHIGRRSPCKLFPSELSLRLLLRGSLEAGCQLEAASLPQRQDEAPEP